MSNIDEILKPYVHYIPLKKDYSNTTEALVHFKDESFVKKMVDETFEYVMDKHTYHHRVLDVWKAISHHPDSNKEQYSEERKNEKSTDIQD